jgi:glycosyltransferase involved in cell wall biosynthesis
LRILILNWRCPRNPRSGGAELFTFEFARRLVAMGDQVEWFSAEFDNALSEEDIDGVHIVRAGRQWTVHWHAFRRYLHNLRGRFDVVVDEVNTIPFFTPLWADVPRVMLIHQLAREVWWYETRFPISAIGYALEPFYLRFYSRTPVITLSGSTKNDLDRLGFRGPVHIVPVGVDARPVAVYPKAGLPTCIYVGRISPSKRIDDILVAFATFFGVVGRAQLWLIGQGHPRYVRKLETMAQRLGIAGAVSFLGRLSVDERTQRLAEAHMILMTSVREGWGLVVNEANACGTPAVVYDVPGLRDSVRDGETGLVVAPNPRKLASAILRLWRDKNLYGRLSHQALASSRSTSFDTTAAAIRQQIGSLMQ